VWVKRSFKVSDYLAQTSQMQLRFMARDLPNNSITEAMIDDVRLEILTCSDVAGDFNGNEAIDPGDVEPFLRVLLGWITEPDQVLRADLTGDGKADGEDIGPFIAAALAP
jgi:hypothetical protein